MEVVENLTRSKIMGLVYADITIVNSVDDVLSQQGDIQ